MAQATTVRSAPRALPRRAVPSALHSPAARPRISPLCVSQPRAEGRLYARRDRRRAAGQELVAALVLFVRDILWGAGLEGALAWARDAILACRKHLEWYRANAWYKDRPGNGDKTLCL